MRAESVGWASIAAGAAGALLLSAPRAARADAASPPPPITPCACEAQGGDLTLGGHHFIIPSSFPTSFVATYFGVRLGGRHVDVPDVPTGFGSYSLSTLGAQLDLDLGVKLTDRVGLFASGQLGVLVGTNVPAMLYNGATYETTARVGGIFRLLRDDATGTQVSLSLTGAYANGLVTSAYPLFIQRVVPTIQAILQGQLGQLFRTPIMAWDGLAGVSAAQSLGPYLALQASANAGISGAVVQPFDAATQARASSSSASWELQAAAGFEADAAPAGVPIAALLEYSLHRLPAAAQSFASTSSGFDHVVSLGVYYSGRRDLQLGLVGDFELVASRLVTNVGPSGAPDAESGQLVILYVW